MIQNINAKSHVFLFSLLLSYALNGQQIDSLKSNEKAINSDTTNRWATVSFGVNVGYYLNKSTITGWFEGDYKTHSTANVSISIKLNLGNKLSIGTGYNRYNLHLTATENLTKTTEVPSTISTEPNYQLNFTGKIKMFYNVTEIPFELFYKFNPIKKHYIPIVSMGVTYAKYSSTFLIQNYSTEFAPLTLRVSGSKPVEGKILFPDNYGFSFTNKNYSTPLVTIGVLRPLSEHSFVKINAKFASNKNIAKSILRLNSEEIIRLSTVKTLQMGLVAEYFVTF
jgi:hypothetical protein